MSLNSCYIMFCLFNWFWLFLLGFCFKCGLAGVSRARLRPLVARRPPCRSDCGGWAQRAVIMSPGEAAASAPPRSALQTGELRSAQPLKNKRAWVTDEVCRMSFKVNQRSASISVRARDLTGGGPCVSGLVVARATAAHKQSSWRNRACARALVLVLLIGVSRLRPLQVARGYFVHVLVCFRAVVILASFWTF